MTGPRVAADGNMRKSLCLIPIAFIAVIGCGGGGSTLPIDVTPTRSAAMEWTDELMACVRASSLGSTPLSRAIGLTTSASYDAWAALDPQAVCVYTQDELLTVTVPPTNENIDIATSYANYRVLVDLFPHEEGRLRQKMAVLNLNPDVVRTGTDSPAALGNLIAKNLIENRANDGSNQSASYTDTSGYSPVNTVDTVSDPNRWQPVANTFPDGSSQTPTYLTPHWGTVRSFASTASVHRCAPPPAFGTPQFQAQVDEVIQTQIRLTDRQKMEAEYWSDRSRTDSTPGRWIIFTQHIIIQRGLSRADQAKMLMLVGNAVMDAGIAAWDSKRQYDSARPITVIRAMYAGQQIQGLVTQGYGVKWMDGKFWKPYQPASFITPPFAELPSSHSAFSSAAAKVLRDFTGSDRLDFGVAFTPGSSVVDPGFTPARPVAISYPTLSSAVEAAGLSQIYGGVQFRSSCEAGWTMGDSVGQQVVSRANDLFSGRR